MSIADYVCHETQCDTLIDNLKVCMSKIGVKYPDTLDSIKYSSIDTKYLKEFKHISCMRRYFGHNEQLQHLDTFPVVVWTAMYMYVFDDSLHVNGNQISVYRLINYEYYDAHIPFIGDAGSKVLCYDPNDLGD